MSFPQISYLRTVFLLYISQLCRKKKKNNIFRHCCMFFTWASLVAQRVKASACNAGDLDSIPGSEDPLEKEMAQQIIIPAIHSISFGKV